MGFFGAFFQSVDREDKSMKQSVSRKKKLKSQVHQLVFWRGVQVTFASKIKTQRHVILVSISFIHLCILTNTYRIFV